MSELGSDRRDRPSVPPVSDKGSGTSSGPSSAAQRREPSVFPKAICGYGHYQHLPLSQAWCVQCGAPVYWKHDCPKLKDLSPLGGGPNPEANRAR